MLPEYSPETSSPKTALSDADIYVLDNAHDAFAARLLLIDQADVSLDAQYYIWRDDVSGKLLLQKLVQAARRGVRVRLLLDDNNTRGMDDILAVLDSEPNIEIRLFNPFVNRHWRSLGYLTDFPRLNRRMHNKSLTADNRVSVVGGRNISDKYFDVNSEETFADMDIMASGGVVSQISQEFDRYWQSDSAYPFAQIVRQVNLKKGRERLYENIEKSDVYKIYAHRLRYSPLAVAIANGDVPYIHAKTQLLSDAPAKALDSQGQVDVAHDIRAAIGEPQHEVYLVSPYFVPTELGVNILKNWVKNGVKTTVFTNSLAATDVAAVHSGYTRYRKDLLRAGVHLYEFKKDNASSRQQDKGLTGSSVTSLHAKTFVIDRQRVFVGSFNLDPRSARLNTEMGLVIYHAGLATQMQQRLQCDTMRHAYHVELDENSGNLKWQDAQNASAPFWTHEPETGFWQRFWTKLLSYLPIERLL